MKTIIYLSVIVFFHTGCTKKKTNQDVSNFLTHSKISRFDFDLFDSTQSEKYSFLSKKHPSVTPIFVRKILGFSGKMDDTAKIDVAFQKFVGYPSLVDTWKKVIHFHQDTSKLYTNLLNIIKRIKWFFPNYHEPNVTLSFLAFNYSIFTIDTLDIVVGLERFMNDTFKVYNQMGFYNYQKEKMRVEFLEAEFAIGLLEQYFSDYMDATNLISSAISKGKILFIANQVISAPNERIMMRYSPEQYNFVVRNEVNFWGFFAESNSFYISDRFFINQMVGDGPYTKGLPTETPARVINWMGFQIVKSFARNHTDYSIEKLVKTKPVQILNQSFYRPHH